MCLFVALLMISVGCSDDSETNPTPPQLPPQASMSVDMGNFSSNQEKSSTAEDVSNFQFAAGNVLFWQTLLAIDLAVPVAAFNEAFNRSFEYLRDDNRWKSEYSFTIGNKMITATLYAEKRDSNSTVIWEMYLSSEGRYEDFLWFSGESKLNNSGGQWVLYKSPDEPRATLTIDWEKADGAAVNSTYTLVDNESDREGSYIEYGLSSETGFTHFYEVSIVSQSSNDYDLSILFNNSSRVGRVKSTAQYGNSDWNCWNEDLENVNCQ